MRLLRLRLCIIARPAQVRGRPRTIVGDGHAAGGVEATLVAHVDPRLLRRLLTHRPRGVLLGAGRHGVAAAQARAGGCLLKLTWLALRVLRTAQPCARGEGSLAVSHNPYRAWTCAVGSALPHSSRPRLAPRATQVIALSPDPCHLVLCATACSAPLRQRAASHAVSSCASGRPSKNPGGNLGSP